MIETDDLRSKIFSALQASWGTATLIAWPNQPFEPVKTSAWIRPVIRVANTQVGELGDDGIGLRDGLLLVSIFAPPGTGSKTALTLAERIESYFRRADIDDIWFDEITSDPQGNDPNGFYHVLVTAPFHSWVGEA